MFVLFGLLDPPELEFAERWRILHPAKDWDRGFSETAVVGNRILFVEETSRNAGAYGCLDASTGKRLWSVPTKLETTHYLSANARYGVVSGERQLFVFDVRNGKKIWSGTKYGFGAGPLLSGKQLISELKLGTLTAIDLGSKRRAWESKFPARVQTKTGFDRATLIGDALWTVDSRGRVANLEAATGKKQWSRLFTGGEVAGFVGTKHGVVVFGTARTEMWNPLSGQRLWHNDTIKGWQSGQYFAASDQLWTIPSDGLLHRYRAVDGRSVGTSQARLPDTRETFSPVPYRGGLLLLSTGPIVRIDAAGRAVGQFDPQEGIFGVDDLGGDLLLRSENGLVRLRPGKDPSVANPRTLAAKPLLLPADRRALVQMGPRVVPFLLEAIPSSKGERRDALLNVLLQVAGPANTEEILALAERVKSPEESYGGYPPALSRWMLEKGNANQVADHFLDRFVSAKDERAQLDTLAFVLRGTSHPVVDVLLARLKDPQSSPYVRGAIYGEIAKSGRADVLETIRTIRRLQRQLDTPIKSFSSTNDFDGDGLPDGVDANPAIAPRPLSDAEKAMVAAFDARFRFDERTDKIGLVDYGDRVKPFELFGWRGGLLPRDRAAAFGLNVPKDIRRSYPFPFIRFESREEGVPAVTMSADGQTATVEIGVTYGGLDGIGYRIQLRKFDGEWYSVEMKETWIS